LITHAPNSRLARINLDEDQHLEAVLTYTSGRKVTTAVVFDLRSGRWWQVGEFEYSWHWDINQAERLMEFGEIVWSGTKELIVRDTSGGTGVASTDLSIYRMHRGLLYKIFAITEAIEDLTGTERCKLTYDDPQSGHPTIIVNCTRTLFKTENGPDKQKESKITRCNAYAWDPRKLIFQMSTVATARLCTAHKE
jgi:hypothetical protein